MRHLSSDKHSIAWFKLAEFVSRGEKEKALGIYKLLMLSIDDPAFAYKLEGDILFAFHDKLALEKYSKSAALYQKDEKFIEAAAIYENLVTLCPDLDEYINKLIELYTKLNLTVQLCSTLKKLFTLQLNRNEIEQSLKTLESMESYDIPVAVCEEIAYELINANFESSLCIKFVNKTLEGYFLLNDRIKLQQFLAKLETINKKYYNEALIQIKE